MKKHISDNLKIDNINEIMHYLQQYIPQMPTAKQREFLEYGCREALFGGSTAGGKSSALLMAALQGISEPRYSALLLRRTYSDLAKPGALMDRSHQWWDNTDAHWNQETKTWRFPSGARISFGYLDSANDHTQYQSAEYQFVGFDEASQFEEKQVMYLHSRLRKPEDWPSWLGCRLRLATNPGGVGHEWIKNRYRIPDEGTLQTIQQYRGGNLIRVFVPSMARDNPHINVEEYLSGLDELDPVTRAQLKEGKWMFDASHLVYYCYQESCNVDCLPKNINLKEWKYVLGSDYASVNDATAFAVCAYSSYEPAVYLVHTEEHLGMSPSEAAAHIDVLTKKFGRFEAIVGDSGGLGAAYLLEMTKHYAIPITPAEKQHKLAYIKLFNGELHNNRLKIVRDSSGSWIKQAKALLWKDGQHLHENQSQHNDSTDAGLYAWRECRHYCTHNRPAPEIEVDPYELAAERRAQKSQWDDAGRNDGSVWNPFEDDKW